MVDVSYKFRNLEKNLMKLVFPITTNQNIKRYIKDLSKNPLDSTKPDIVDDLINDNILLEPFNETILPEKKVVIFIYPYDGNLKYQPTGRHTFIIDIICPYNNWFLEGESGLIRPIRIADEISQLIDGQNIAGVGDVNIANYKSGKLNTSYGYFSLFVEIQSVTLKGRDI